jgi:thiamine kinase-like enzyme
MTVEAPDDTQLLIALREAFAETGAGVPSAVRRRPSEYQTSFPLEQLTVSRERGDDLHLAFKRLEWEALDAGTRLAKPRFLHDSRREPAVYSSVLAAAPSGPPRYFGSVVRDGGARWLFVEWVEGRELYQVGERETWKQVARWLGGLHAALAPDLDRLVEEAHLSRDELSDYTRWIGRAREFAVVAERSVSARRFLDWLHDRYEGVAEALLELPRTVIHGDFYASNVLVADAPGAIRVAPVDWEAAAAGPGLLDLAALGSGSWASADREQFASAYASAPGAPSFSPRKLDLARLHLAVRWLGWAPPQWVPPEGQRHDWLADAVAIAEGLDL